jgi:single-stranded-DNA-specific exonuclease
MGDDLETLPTYLDLVALATVADLVPLVGENRVLVHYGLRRFAATQNLGLTALLEVADVDGEAVGAGQLGFQLAPRINAAGRIGESADALRLLLTEDPAEARRLAAHLDATNGRRRDEDRRTLDEALSFLEREYQPDRDYGVVLAGAGWHPGVIGIVASRIVERIHRPVVMVALGEAMGRGSARSIPGFHLYEALRECAEHLDRFGGHRQAAGMDVRPERLEAFRSAFNRAARERLDPSDLTPRLRPDLDVRLADIDAELVRWLRYLGPHGIGNPGPMLRARGVRVTGARVVGANHLKVRLEDDGTTLEGIGFGLADRCPPEAILREPYDVLFRAERNEWRGRVSAQAKLADLRPSADAAP